MNRNDIQQWLSNHNSTEKQSNPCGEQALKAWLERHAGLHFKRSFLNRLQPVSCYDSIDRTFTSTIGRWRADFRQTEHSLLFYNNQPVRTHRSVRTSSQKSALVTTPVFGGSAAGVFSAILIAASKTQLQLADLTGSDPSAHAEFMGTLPMPATPIGVGVIAALLFGLIFFLLTRPDDDERVMEKVDPVSAVQTLADQDEPQLKSSGVRRLFQQAVFQHKSGELTDTEAGLVLSVPGRCYALYDPETNQLQAFDRADVLDAYVKHRAEQEPDSLISRVAGGVAQGLSAS